MKKNFSFWSLWKNSKQWHWVLFIVLLCGTLFLWQQHLEDYKTSVLPSKTPAPFDGTTPPLGKTPKWTSLTAAEYKGPYENIPQSKFMDLPAYDLTVLATPSDQLGWKTEKDLAIRNAKATYTTLYLGSYEGTSGSHPALDMKALKGTPVYAIANGIVTKAADESAGFGKHIVIKHPDAPSYDNPKKTEVLYSGYAHLDQILVTEGEVVKKGQLIGKSGDTGLATGPHLHFQLDRESAPFHPFWPFTSKEASAAGLTFFDAVNAGLGREKAASVTVSPMLYVQKYQKGTVTHVDTPKNPDTKPDELPPANENVKPPENKPSESPNTPSSNHVDTPVVSEPNDQPTVDTPAIPVNPPTHFAVEHPANFNRNNPVAFTVKALDKNDKVVSNYQPVDYLYLEVIAGGGQVPPYLDKQDFENGIATFEVVPTSKVGLQVSVTDGVIEGKSKVLQAASVETNQNIDAQNSGTNSDPSSDSGQNSNQTNGNTTDSFDNKVLFTDVLASSKHWEAISFLKEHNVINGYGNGEFKPKGIVRRDEALKFIFNGTNINLISVKSLPFKDTSLRDWSAAYIATAYQRGIVNGFEDKTFRPGDTVTRAQFLKMLFETMKVEVPSRVKKAPFADVHANSWEAPYVAYAKDKNLIDSNGKNFNPNQGMTREEVAEVMYRTIVLKINKAPAYSTQLTASGDEVRQYFK